VNPAREPDDEWRWDDPFARQLEAPESDDRPPEARSSTFDQLIEGWRREGRVPEWPDAPEATATDRGTPSSPAVEADEPTAARDAESDAGSPGDAAGESDDDGDDHYVPPEPPPLPKLGAPAVVGLGLLGLGLLLLIAPWWIGVSETFAIPLGLLALASGLGWLVLRLWPAPPPTGDGDGEDDGAVV
jgi:hypothetical protein